MSCGAGDSVLGLMAVVLKRLVGGVLRKHKATGRVEMTCSPCAGERACTWRRPGSPRTPRACAAPPPSPDGADGVYVRHLLKHVVLADGHTHLATHKQKQEQGGAENDS